MAKKTIKVLCDNVSSNQNTSQVRFFTPMPAAAPTAPGQPRPAATAKTIVMIQYNDPKSAKEWEPGKEYELTIQG